MQKTAMITGVTGQDGSYLADFLLGKGYRIIGLSRTGDLTGSGSGNAKHLQGSIDVIACNLLDMSSLLAAIRQYQPHEIYNLASQSHPGKSWDTAIETGDSTALGAHRLFEAIRQENPACRVYQASSSEMFGGGQRGGQNEQTQFNPLNPYAVAKVYAHHMATIYRQYYGMFISTGILFNHESSRRGMHFITQKVTYGAACIKLGIQNSPALNERGEPIVKDGKLALGNLDAQRDWGYAGDYVEAMWLMLQQENPDDFVIGTGQAHTIKQLCELAFSAVLLNWQEHVLVDPQLMRSVEVGAMVADISKARKVLGWTPKTSFEALVQMMLESNLKQLSIA